MQRRSFLTSVPAAIAATQVAAVQRPTDNDPAGGGLIDEENHALLALGDQLPQIEAAYHDACAAWDAMWREWQPKWPLAPDPCISDRLGLSDDFERDITGTALVRAGRTEPLRLFTLKHLEWRRGHTLAILAKDARRKKSVGAKQLAYWQSEVERCDLGIALLPGYLAECERIRRQSNVGSIDSARANAAGRLFSHAREVLGLPSQTTVGLRIKAQAAAALGSLRADDAKWGALNDIMGGEDHLAVLLGKAVRDLP